MLSLYQSKFLLRHDSPPGRGGGHTSVWTYLPPLGCTLTREESGQCCAVYVTVV